MLLCCTVRVRRQDTEGDRGNTPDLCLQSVRGTHKGVGQKQRTEGSSVNR